MREKSTFGTREAFAEALGLTEPMVGYYERGDRVPDALVLARYRECLKVNLNWLVCGEGDMFESAQPVTGNAATMLAGFQRLSEGRQLDMLAILRIDLKREGLL